MAMRPDYQSTAVAARHALVASPVLDQLRAQHSVWSAVVLWDPYPQAVSDETLRYELARIKQTGFQAVRFHCLAGVPG